MISAFLKNLSGNISQIRTLFESNRLSTSKFRRETYNQFKEIEAVAGTYFDLFTALKNIMQNASNENDLKRAIVLVETERDALVFNRQTWLSAAIAYRDLMQYNKHKLVFALTDEEERYFLGYFEAVNLFFFHTDILKGEVATGTTFTGLKKELVAIIEHSEKFETCRERCITAIDECIEHAATDWGAAVRNFRLFQGYAPQ